MVWLFRNAANNKVVEFYFSLNWVGNLECSFGTVIACCCLIVQKFNLHKKVFLLCLPCSL